MVKTCGSGWDCGGTAAHLPVLQLVLLLHMHGQGRGTRLGVETVGYDLVQEHPVQVVVIVHVLINDGLRTFGKQRECVGLEYQGSGTALRAVGMRNASGTHPMPRLRPCTHPCDVGEGMQGFGGVGVGGRGRVGMHHTEGTSVRRSEGIEEWENSCVPRDVAGNK